MIDTSNNVLETKRRFEYGIHQIILEVGDVMKTANTSMQKRLNELNDGILENHNNALVNLSSRIGESNEKFILGEHQGLGTSSCYCFQCQTLTMVDSGKNWKCPGLCALIN